MNMQRKMKRNGSALALVLCVLVVLMFLGVGYLDLGLNSRLFAIRDASNIVARTAADAGLEEAIFEMTKKLPNTDGITPTTGTLPNFEASNPASYTYKTDAAYNVTSGSRSRWYCRAESQGSYNQAARKVVARLIIRGLFNRPIQVETTVSLNQSAVIGSPGFSDIIIGSNSTNLKKTQAAISLYNSSVINGEVLVGVGQDPAKLIDNKGTINNNNNGQGFAATEPYVWTPVTSFMPSSLLSLSSSGNINLTNNNPTKTITAGNYRYDYIRLGQDTVLTIQGNVTLYLKPSNPKSTNALDIGKNGQLQLEPDSSLTIYMDGNLVLGNSGPMNGIDPTTNLPMSADATRFKVYGLPNCTTIDLTVNGQFYGAIYAPNAAVTTFNSFPFVGAIEAYSFTAKQGGTFTYDERLANVNPFSSGVRFIIDRWWEGAAGETPPF